jgi:flagellar assembly protein FliH
MTSTSADRVVLRGLAEGDLGEPGSGGDLRTGTWTRLGGAGVLGDAVTESTLTTLTDRARAAAQAQGYAAGWAEGRRRATETATELETRLLADAAEARAAAVAEQQRLVDALTTAAARCADDFDQRYDVLAGRALDLALQIAEEVLQRELAVAHEPGLDAIRRALAPLDRRAEVTVRMHPADRAALDESVLEQLAGEGRAVTLVDDPGLSRGDAVAETDHSLVDATIAGAMTRVREVLGR